MNSIIHYMDGLAQDCSIPIANALKISNIWTNNLISNPFMFGVKELCYHWLWLIMSAAAVI